MSKKISSKALSIAVGTAFVTSLAASNIATAAENGANPFTMTQLSNGYMVADAKEGKCGEGKCGGTKAPKAPEEGKCGEGKCGGTKAPKAPEEGKCGEGKCGGTKAPKAPEEGKCGEGKCGGTKK